MEKNSFAVFEIYYIEFFFRLKNNVISFSVASYLSALPLPTSLDFKADHPFFYCIKEKSGIVLLAGRFISARGIDTFSVNNHG